MTVLFKLSDSLTFITASLHIYTTFLGHDCVFDFKFSPEKKPFCLLASNVIDRTVVFVVIFLMPYCKLIWKISVKFSGVFLSSCSLHLEILAKVFMWIESVSCTTLFSCNPRPFALFLKMILHFAVEWLGATVLTAGIAWWIHFSSSSLGFWLFSQLKKNWCDTN